MLLPERWLASEALLCWCSIQGRITENVNHEPTTQMLPCRMPLHLAEHKLPGQAAIQGAWSELWSFMLLERTCRFGLLRECPGCG